MVSVLFTKIKLRALHSKTKKGEIADEDIPNDEFADDDSALSSDGVFAFPTSLSVLRLWMIKVTGKQKAN